MPTLRKYVLKHGKYHSKQEDGTDKVAVAGDEIELSDAQAKSYADMITPIAIHRVEEKVSKARDKAEAEARAEGASDGGGEG